MELLLVGWLLGILSGGLVAVMTQVLAFRYALRLQDAERAARDRAARRALVAEVRENLECIPVEASKAAFVQIVRTAWDDARALDWPDDLFATVAAAYAAGATLNGAMTERGAFESMWAKDPARDAFARALKELEQYELTLNRRSGARRWHERLARTLFARD